MARPLVPDGRTRLLGIVGDPIEHSLSPSLHSTVLHRLDRNLLYLPLPVSKRRLPALLALARELEMVGLNVTTPYKEEVTRLVTSGDAESARTGMVNTVSFGARGTLGVGTDGAGILDWLESLELDFEPLLILGSGPTARSLIHRAWARGWSATVVTRDPRRVRRVLDAWPRIAAREQPLARAARPAVIAWDDLEAMTARPRVWISTLPARGVRTPRSFRRALDSRVLFLDMNYGDGRTALAERARAQGARAATGIGPLLHQAARSLSIWLGRNVEVKEFVRAWGGSRSELRFGR